MHSPRRAMAWACAAVAALAAVPVSAHAAPTATRLAAAKISMSVLDVSPTTPVITPKTRTLTISLSLTNLTADALNGVVIEGLRGAPLDSPETLDAAIALPSQPDASASTPITTKHPVRLDLAPGAKQTIDFTTTTSVTDGAAGICLCTSAGVYPLYFTASLDGVALGGTQTYLPAFFQAPAKAQVTWVWPLIDRPHRLTSDTVFTDDDLSYSIKGGRLDRALETLETVTALDPTVPLTVVLDPELLDELIVMADATTHYTVRSAGRAAQPGTGASAATSWLQRLRDLLDLDPAITLALTPFADPDLDTVLGSGLQLAPTPAAMTTRIDTWLGSRVPLVNLAWPVSGAISAQTASALASAGLSTVLLGPGAVPAAALPVNGDARLVSSAGGDLSVLSTAKDLNTTLLSAVSVGGASDAVQQLAAQVAARVARDPKVPQHVVLAPPRLIDPAPQQAAMAIVATTSNFWTTPGSLIETVPTFGGALSADGLTRPGRLAPRVSADSIDIAQTVTDDVSTLTSLFVPTTAQNPLIAALPAAVQRVESSAWSTNVTAGQSFAGQLASYVDNIRHGVFIVNPSGTYTLASSNSPLPITIENDLDYAVKVTVDVSTVNRLPGFTAKTQKVTIDPHSKLPIHVPTKVVRSGRIQVQAQLHTLSGVDLGAPVYLSVRSTALGRIGLIITIVSGAVLALALLRRFWFRFRRRRAPGTPTKDSALTSSGPAP